MNDFQIILNCGATVATIKHYKAKFEDSAVKQELDKIPGTLMRKAQ